MMHLLALALALANPDAARIAHADALCMAAGYRDGVRYIDPAPKLGWGAWLVTCHPTKWQREHAKTPHQLRAGRL